MQSEEKKRFFKLLKKGAIPIVLIVSLLMVSFAAVQYAFHIPNASAVNVLSSNIGVYWNAGATSTVTTINWGNVTLGSEKDVTVYVKNLGPTPLVLSMNTSAWNPPAAYPKMYLCWDYGGGQVGSGSIVKVTLKLFISAGISGVRNFDFNINIGVGLEKSLDMNGDGAINISDASLLAMAWGTVAGGPKYDYRCDLNNDGFVNIADVAMFGMGYGS